MPPRKSGHSILLSFSLRSQIQALLGAAAQRVATTDLLCSESDFYFTSVTPTVKGNHGHPLLAEQTQQDHQSLHNL